MFKFEFDMEGEDTAVGADCPARTESSQSQRSAHPPFTEIDLHDLLGALPPVISYSPICITLASGETVELCRRDHFDARFQLVSETRGEEGEAALDFLNAPSDLVPGVYEGGLKTWECSLDLASYLHAMKVDVHGKRVLELGCGTAVPCLYLLHELFSTPPGDQGMTHVHLQDFNRSVLELVTLPNILLTWYGSPASESYRAANSAGELAVDAALLAAFAESLATYSITLRFFSGSWEAFEMDGAGYDLVLASETIYRLESLRPLARVLRRSCERDAACVVAAKVLYFGVGGGVAEFVRVVESMGGTIESAWERNVGVGRRIMRVVW